MVDVNQTIYRDTRHKGDIDQAMRALWPERRDEEAYYADMVARFESDRVIANDLMRTRGLTGVGVDKVMAYVSLRRLGIQSTAEGALGRDLVRCMLIGLRCCCEAIVRPEGNLLEAIESADEVEAVGACKMCREVLMVGVAPSTRFCDTVRTAYQLCLSERTHKGQGFERAHASVLGLILVCLFAALREAR